MPGDDPEFITPPVNLKAKAGPIKPGVDEAALARAENAIASMSEQYETWALEDVKKLKAAIADVKAKAVDDRKEAVATLFGIAHDVKGQGGSFGYPMVTAVAHQMCRFIETAEEHPFTDAHANVMNVHVEAIAFVLMKKMRGDGGRPGDDLLSGLQATIDKVQAKYPPSDK